MAILDPELKTLLARKQFYEDKEQSREAEIKGLLDYKKPIDVSIHFKGDIKELENLGFEPYSTLKGFARGIVHLDGLASLSAHDNVLSIETEKKDYLDLHESIPDIRADDVWSRSGDNFSGYNGTDVIVGVVDTGIDFRHHSFRNPDSDGTTRVLKIWDQTLSAQGGETVPGPINIPIVGNLALGYGVEYDVGQINNAIRNTGTGIAARHQDQNGHGTHVAGIAAGDGSQSGGCHGGYHYIGVAPRADIIAVRLHGLTSGDTNPPSASSESKMMDAIYYIFNEAKAVGKPCVINLSLGLFSEVMDGTSQVSVAINNLLTNNSAGLTIVFTAGNGAASSFHARAEVPAGPTDILDLPFNILPGDSETRTIKILYSGTNLQARLTAPGTGGNRTVAWTDLAQHVNISTTANGTGFAQITNDPDSITIRLSAGANSSHISGRWLIELQDTGSSATFFDAFCLYGSTHDDKSPYFLDHVTVRNTLNQHGTTAEVLTVGSYSVGSDNLASSSGRGLTLDSRIKPELAAPGVGILSAGLEKNRTDDTCEACCSDCCADFYVSKSGTSMAAPHVAGAVALLFQKNPGLTHTEVKNAIQANAADKPSGTTLDEDLGWGSGKLDIKAAIDNIAEVNPPPASPAPAEPVTIIATPPDHTALLRESFLGTNRGPEFLNMFKKHFEEVRRLINTNKRVATIWHRSKGPAWVRAGFRAINSPEASIPFEIEGLSIIEGLKRMAEILKRYGSEVLIDDITNYESELNKVKKGMGLNEIIEVLGSRYPVNKTSLV